MEDEKIIIAESEMLVSEQQAIIFELYYQSSSSSRQAVMASGVRLLLAEHQCVFYASRKLLA